MNSLNKNSSEREQLPETISCSDLSSLQNLWNSSDFELVFGSSHWTRITVHEGSRYEKDEVLSTILYSVSPVEVYPCLYQIDGHDSFFLVRNCSLFIRRLALSNLQMLDSFGKLKFKLSVTTFYLSTSLEPLNPQFQIRELLKKRTSKEHKTIDLTNLSEDILLKDMFFKLNILQYMHCVMTILKNDYNKSSAIKPTTLILQHNDLTSIDHLELKGTPFIKHLDLRYNKLTWEAFQKFSAVKIESLWLSGNPLCSDVTQAEYNSKIIDIFDQLKKLDGIDVSHTFRTVVNKKIALIKNYICDTYWSDLVDHFCHHYFELMESPNRHQLARMYHQRATFSFSACRNPSSDGIELNIMSKYLTTSRNLLTLSDITKAYSTLIIGPENIVQLFNSFPVVQYDPFSFTIEVPIAKEDMVMINISGIFQELDGLFFFNRTFILAPNLKNEGEWKISNDMMYLTMATQGQSERSFSKVRTRLKPLMKLALNPTSNDKDALIPVVCDLTKLTKDWGTRLLDEASWDLERALQAFIDQLKANQIPMIAFSV